LMKCASSLKRIHLQLPDLFLLFGGIRS